MPPTHWPLRVLGHSVMLSCAQPGSVSACLDIAAVGLEFHNWASFINADVLREETDSGEGVLAIHGSGS